MSTTVTRRPRSQRAATFSLAAMIAAGSFTGLAASSLAPAVAAPGTQAVTSDTCETSIAFVVDTSSSFTPEEFQAQKDAIKETIKALAADPAMTPTISVYNFARQGETRDVQLRGTDGKLYTTIGDLRAAGTQMAGFDQRIPDYNKGIVDMPADSQDLMDWVDGITQDVTFSPTENPDWNYTYGGETWTHGSFGTNWESGLSQLLGKHHDTIIFSSDGQPNMKEGMDNKWPEGQQGDKFVIGTDEANDKALAVAEQLRNDGAEIVPLYVKTSSSSFKSAEDALATMSQMTGKADAVKGVDYFEADSSSVMGESLLKAAVTTCSPVTQVDKTLSKGVNTADVQVGDTVSYDVTVKATGNYPSKQVVVTDLGGEKLTDVAIESVTQGEAGENGTWNVGEMKQGTTATAKVTAKVAEGYTPGDDLVNDINVATAAEPNASTSGDPNDTVDDDTDRFDRVTTPTTVTPPVPADVKVNKVSTDEDGVKAGETTSFRITVKNASETEAASDVVLDDEIGQGMTIESITVENDAPGTITVGEDNASASWTIGSLEPGQEVSVVVTAKVAQDAAGELINHAYVSSADDPRPEEPGTTNETVDEDDDNYDADTVTVEEASTPEPTQDPTTDPTPEPSVTPSADPSTDPTPEPSTDPSVTPSADPSTEPTGDPSVQPTSDPSTAPAVTTSNDGGNVDKTDPANQNPVKTTIDTGIDTAARNPGATVAVLGLAVAAIAGGVTLLARRRHDNG